jgi:O-antigen ligase
MTLDSGYTSGRDTIAVAALGLFKEKPILGYGSITAWKALGESLGLAARDSHNLITQTALEGGVIGMLIYWITMGYCGFRIFALRRRADMGLVGVLFITLLAGNMGVNYQITKEHWFIMSQVVGCVAATAGTSQWIPPSFTLSTIKT